MTTKILVIDDEAYVREIIRLGLSNQYEVIEATSGKNILDIIETQQVSLIIMDILMDEQEGIETLVELREKHIELPIIMISVDAEYLDLAKELGATDVHQKPIDLSVLTPMVEKYIN